MYEILVAIFSINAFKKLVFALDFASRQIYIILRTDESVRKRKNMDSLIDKMANLNETDRKILVEARVEFETKGYYRANIDDVAKRLNLGKGTIYRHFKDKISLFATVIYDLLGAAASSIEKSGEKPDFQSAFEDYLERLVQASRQGAAVQDMSPENNIMVLLQEKGTMDESRLLCESLFEMRDRFQKVLEMILKRGIGEKRVADGLDPVLTAEFVAASVHAFIYSRYVTCRMKGPDEPPVIPPADLGKLKTLIRRSIGLKENCS